MRIRTNFSLHWAKQGFTLFELLVTISIIGLLIALATVSFSSAQEGARDARRRGDLTSVRNAFEQYYSANTAYPNSCAGVNTVSVGADLAPHLPGGMPVDPDPQPDTVYSFACDTASYCGCVLMEREGSGNASDSNCTMATGGDFYCVQSLQ